MPTVREIEQALFDLAPRERAMDWDNVGHLLTRATVQVEAFRVVHTGEPVEQDLAAVADTLHEALDEIRTSVHNLRDDASDLSVQVRAVVRLRAVCLCNVSDQLARSHGIADIQRFHRLDKAVRRLQPVVMRDRDEVAQLLAQADTRNDAVRHCIHLGTRIRRKVHAGVAIVRAD